MQLGYEINASNRKLVSAELMLRWLQLEPADGLRWLLQAIRRRIDVKNKIAGCTSGDGC